MSRSSRASAQFCPSGLSCHSAAALLLSSFAVVLPNAEQAPQCATMHMWSSCCMLRGQWHELEDADTQQHLLLYTHACSCVLHECTTYTPVWCCCATGTCSWLQTLCFQCRGGCVESELPMNVRCHAVSESASANHALTVQLTNTKIYLVAVDGVAISLRTATIVLLLPKRALTAWTSPSSLAMPCTTCRLPSEEKSCRFCQGNQAGFFFRHSCCCP